MRHRIQTYKKDGSGFVSHLYVNWEKVELEQMEECVKYNTDIILGL